MIKESKASLKRIKDLKSLINNRIGGILTPFREKYLAKYLSWGLAPIIKDAEKYPDLNSLEDFEKMFLNKTYESHGFVKISKYSDTFTPDDCYSLYSRKERCINQLKNINITTLGFLTESSKNYDVKYEKLLDKLARSGIKYNHQLKVKQVSDLGGEFGFEVTDGEMVVHARLIFANGVINAPHYRFITTVRNNK